MSLEKQIFGVVFENLLSSHQSHKLIQPLHGDDMWSLQAELAQGEAEQQQGAGHFAEAAALTSQAHRWQNRAAKVP